MCQFHVIPQVSGDKDLIGWLSWTSKKLILASQQILPPGAPLLVAPKPNSKSKTGKEGGQLNATQTFKVIHSKKKKKSCVSLYQNVTQHTIQLNESSCQDQTGREGGTVMRHSVFYIIRLKNIAKIVRTFI